MGLGFYLSVAMLPVMIILTFIFAIKEKVDNAETRIYKYILITSIVMTILEIISAMLYGNYFETFAYTLIAKMVLISYVSINYLFCNYFMSVCNKSKLKINILRIISVLFVIIILFTETKFVEINDAIAPQGIPIVLTFSYAIMLGLYQLILAIVNMKSIISRKFTPFYLFLLGGAINTLIIYFYPTSFMVGYIWCLTIIVMNFTIENPDVKLLGQIETARLHAEQANRAKSDFLSSMSHEIRTPLNAIVGFSEDIRDYIDRGDTERIKEDADLIVSSSETLLEIVGNIIDISKIESEKLDVVEKVYNPKEEIEKLTKATATRIGDKPIDFHLSIAPDIPYELIGDSGKVKQVINNLLTNSIKYTEQGEINLRIECINQDNISVLKITCQDTGRGIKKENIEKLFNKFERLDIERNTTTEGTGLGLAITKSIVEMMGGKINVQSRFGEGSIFIAQIPQKIQTLMSPVGNVEEISTPIQKAHIEEQPRIVNSESNNNIKKVLIVDDNKLNITVAKKVLDEIVEEVESVMSGQECLDKINAGEKYDVILMDIMMPEMSGETTFKKLREISGFDIPVIALTADAESTSKAKYLSEGFNDYIAKPFKKDEIKTILDKYSSSTGTQTENTTNVEEKKEVPKFDPNVDRFKGSPTYMFSGDDVTVVDKDDI